MGAIQKATELVSSACFGYESQGDLVKLIRLVDPSDIELFLTLEANASPRLRELYSKITGFGGILEEVHRDYADRVIQLPRSKNVFPPTNPIDILPVGMRRFVADLDELIKLSEGEHVIPLLRILKEEDEDPSIETPHLRIPNIDNRARALDPSFAGHLHQLIEDNVYAPRLKRLGSIGRLALGSRPYFISWAKVRRDSIAIKDCLDALNSVPGKNSIAHFRIGVKPRDEGGREYYDWQYGAVMWKSAVEEVVRMEFGEPTDVNKIEESLRAEGIDVKLIKS